MKSNIFVDYLWIEFKFLLLVSLKLEFAHQKDQYHVVNIVSVWVTKRCNVCFVNRVGNLLSFQRRFAHEMEDFYLKNFVSARWWVISGRRYLVESSVIVS